MNELKILLWTFYYLKKIVTAFSLKISTGWKFNSKYLNEAFPSLLSVDLITHKIKRGEKKMITQLSANRIWNNNFNSLSKKKKSLFSVNFSQDIYSHLLILKLRMKTSEIQNKIRDTDFFFKQIFQFLMWTTFLG